MMSGILIGILIGATLMAIASAGRDAEAQEAIIASLEIAKKYAEALQKAKDYVAGFDYYIPEDDKKELERILDGR